MILMTDTYRTPPPFELKYCTFCKKSIFEITLDNYKKIHVPSKELTLGCGAGSEQGLFFLQIYDVCKCVMWIGKS